MVRVVDYDYDDYISEMYSDVPSSLSDEGSNSRNSISFQSSSLSYEGSNSRNPISFQSRYSGDDDFSKAVKASLESYSEENGLSQAIKASLETAENKRVLDFSQDSDDNDDVQAKYSSSSPRKLLKGESSNSKAEAVYIDSDDRGSEKNDVGKDTFLCCVCVDEKPNMELFQVKGCPHSYCSECIAKHVASTLNHNITNVKCPVFRCEGRFEPEHCRSILPPQVCDRWGEALCEALILGAEKYYCPYIDCSALLINDDGATGDDHQEEGIITSAECPYCWRLFCAQCRVPWHSDMSCSVFQSLNKDQRHNRGASRKKWGKRQRICI